MRNTAINYIVADAETMPLYVQLLENGKPYSLPAGAIIEINFENPQGLRFPRDGTVRDYEQGQILYNIDSSDIAIAGKMYASVTVIDGTKRLTWQSFVLKVSRNLSDNQVAPPDVIGPWQSEIEEKLSDQAGQLSQHASTLASHAGQLSSHAGQLSDHETRIVTLENAETNIDVDLTNIKARIDTVESDLPVTQATATDARNIANNAAVSAATAGSRAEEGITKADNAQGAVDALDVRVTTLEQSSGSSTDLTEIENAIATLRSQLSALQAESTAKWVLLNDVDNRSRVNATSITDLDNRVAVLESE